MLLAQGIVGKAAVKPSVPPEDLMFHSFYKCEPNSNCDIHYTATLCVFNAGFYVKLLQYFVNFNFPVERVSCLPKQIRKAPTTQTPPACFFIVKLEGSHISPLRCKEGRAAVSLCPHSFSLLPSGFVNINAIKKKWINVYVLPSGCKDTVLCKDYVHDSK